MSHKPAIVHRPSADREKRAAAERLNAEAYEYQVWHEALIESLYGRQVTPRGRG